MMTVEIRPEGSGSGNVMLSFILGAVLVAVAVVGFFMWDNYKSHTGGQPAGISLTVKSK